MPAPRLAPAMSVRSELPTARTRCAAGRRRGSSSAVPVDSPDAACRDRSPCPPQFAGNAPGQLPSADTFATSAAHAPSRSGICAEQRHLVPAGAASSTRRETRSTLVARPLNARQTSMKAAVLMSVVELFERRVHPEKAVIPLRHDDKGSACPIASHLVVRAGSSNILPGLLAGTELVRRKAFPPDAEAHPSRWALLPWPGAARWKTMVDPSSPAAFNRARQSRAAVDRRGFLSACRPQRSMMNAVDIRSTISTPPAMTWSGGHGGFRPQLFQSAVATLTR